MTDLINWLLNAVQGFFSDLVEFLTDLPKKILEAVLNAIAMVFESIPVPQFIDSGLQFLVNGVDPSILYFLQRSDFPEALAIIGAGFAFRLTRKLFTLGQW